MGDFEKLENDHHHQSLKQEICFLVFIFVQSCHMNSLKNVFLSIIDYYVLCSFYPEFTQFPFSTLYTLY